MFGFLANFLGQGANQFKARPAQVQQSPDLTQGIQGAQGQYGNLWGQQQSFADMLRGWASGQGPNPALEQLKQTTGQNIQQSTGMLASQRGLNPAMAARVAAQTGAQMNQQAAGQGATLAAQQQAQYGQMYSDQLAGMGQQNLGQQNVLQGALANYNNANVNATNSANQINADVAKQNSQFGQQLVGGLLNGAGGALGLKLAHGGEVDGPASELGRMFMAEGGPVFAWDGKVPGTPEVAGDSEKNDKVPAMLSPGEIVIPRTHASPEGARSFVEALQRRSGKSDGYEKVLMARGGRVGGKRNGR